MQKALFFFLSLCASLLGSWKEDYLQGKQLSQEQGLPLVLAFVGSDWCPWSAKLESEVLLSSDFLTKIEGKFVLVKINFPKLAPLSQEVRRENEKLKEHFQVQEFPTLILLDPSGEIICKKTDLLYSAGELAENIQTAAAKYADLKKADLKNLSFGQLQASYLEAKQLGSPVFKDKLLEIGLKQDKGIFFLLEKYALLVEKGQRRSDEAKELRRRILRRDSKNKEGGIRSLAILDFLSKATFSKKTYRTESVVEPLLAYLIEYGKKDPQHVWEIQTMLSQFFFTRNEIPQALKYAKGALESAPESLKPDLAQAVEFLSERLPRGDL